MDVYEIDPYLVLEFPLVEVNHIALNKSAFKSWKSSVEEQAMEDAKKERR